MNKKVLIVDDEKDVLTTLEKRLSDGGYDVIKAESGKDAIILAKAKHPDLIILDIVMPEMDGSATAQILKNDPETKDIPVLFLTCLITKDEEKDSRVIGGKYFIAKPYEPNELLQIINKHIKE